MSSYLSFNSVLPNFATCILYSRALEIKKQLLGWNHPDVAIALGNLSNLALNTEQLQEAEEYAAEAWNIYQVNKTIIRLKVFGINSIKQQSSNVIMLQRDVNISTRLMVA